MRLVADCRAGSGLPKGLSLGSGLQPFMPCKVKTATKTWQRACCHCLVVHTWRLLRSIGFRHSTVCTAQDCKD